MEFAELISQPKLDGVILRTSYTDKDREFQRCCMCITGHHLILSSRIENVPEIWLLHSCIDCVERKPNVINNILQGGILIIKCKDLRIISLEIETPQEYLNVANSLEKLSNIIELEYLYPFFFRPMFNILEDGYTMFSPEMEYAKLLATDEWRLTNVNKDYSICSTYSSLLIVPKIISDEQIIESSAFRDGGRFPIFSYKHENGAIMLRSSQPISSSQGGGKRCRSDEAILNVILGQSKKGFIVDTWGKNRSSNSETDQHYTQWRKVTRSIGNLSSVSSILDSFSKLIDACNDITCSYDKWLSRLDNSNWLTLVLNSLNAACIVAQCLDQDGSPVLVHGGKGLDSTLIVTSLVQIILNPDCRTVRGLQALLEREWIQAGFPFTTRHKHSCYTPSNLRTKSSSATFLLLLDCIYQIHCQFPCSFEFGTNFLIVLFEQSYSSQYGTFLGDCESERTAMKLYKKTTSLWSFLNRPDILNSFLNPIYEPNQSVIWPSVAPISLVLWSDLYLRWVIDQSQTKNMLSQIQNLITHEKELRSKAMKLRRQVIELSKELQDLNITSDSETLLD